MLPARQITIPVCGNCERAHKTQNKRKMHINAMQNAKQTPIVRITFAKRKSENAK